MDFDVVVDRTNSESVKWHYFPDNVLPLWVADMDFKSPEAVMEALHQRVEHGVFGYAKPPEGLNEIIRERLKCLYRWKVEPAAIDYVPGVVSGVNMAVQAVCEPGDAVIFQVPAYPPFFNLAQNGGFRMVENQLIHNGDGRYLIDFDLFEQQIIGNKVKAFVLCNPQNPTGRVFTREELTKLAEICLRHKVWIISDEIHCDLLFDGNQHIPIASLSPEVEAITLTYMAPSKTYNIAGLHASVSIIPNKLLREGVGKSRRGMVSHPSLLSLFAARAAYEQGNEWLQELLLYLQKNRDWLVGMLPKALPGLKAYKPEATYLLWLDCRETGLEEPQKFFLEKALVGLNDGLGFGEVGKGFVRFNFGCPRSILEEAVKRMSEAYKKH